MLTWLKNNWLRIIGIILLSLLGLGLFFRFAKGYVWADWTGFEQKTLWDWIEIALIPITLALGAIWFEIRERRVESERIEERRKLDLKIARENRQEVELDNFIEVMTELLLEKKLKTDPRDEVKDLARIRTLATLRRLDGLDLICGCHW